MSPSCHRGDCQHLRTLASISLPLGIVCSVFTELLFLWLLRPPFVKSGILTSDMLMVFTLPFLCQFTCFLYFSSLSIYHREGDTSLFHLLLKSLCASLEKENVTCCSGNHFRCHFARAHWVTTPSSVLEY